jgi:SlyX protein
MLWAEIKILRFLSTTLLWFSMIKKESPQSIATPDDLCRRLQILEEKFEYQDQTIDALNEVIIDQQAQISALEDQIRRFQAMLSAIEDTPGGGEEPPPPHY